MVKKNIAAVLTSVVGAFLFSLFLKDILEAPSLFAAANTNDGIQLSDFYSKIGDESNVRSLSKEVVVVSTDGIGRKEMAELITAVDSMGAKVIGMDLLFLSRQDEDSLLIDAIMASQKIVLPYGLARNEDAESYSLQDSCYFQGEMTNKKCGAVNLDGLSIRSIIRVFKPTFKLRKGKIDNFAAAIARLYSDGSYKELKERKNATELINYHDVCFSELSWKDVLKNDVGDMLRDKIVLLGTTSSYADIHSSPVKAEMPGVYIQAYTIDTIIQKRYVSQVHPIVNYIIAVLFSFVFCSFVYYVRQNVKYIGRLLVRICQLLLMGLFFIVGSIFYLKADTYINLSLALSMIGMSLLMLDIVTGLYWVYNKLNHGSK